jgi:WD40 repeat protein
VGTDARVSSWRLSDNTFLDLPIQVREVEGTEGRLFAALDDQPERVLYVPGSTKDSDLGTLIDPASAAVVAMIPHIFGTISFSRDNGELRIFGTSDGGNRAWNAISGDPLPELRASIRQAYGLFSAPAANVYVAYDINGTASSYSAINSGELRQIRAFSASINELITLSPNRRWVARLLPNGNARLRSLSGSGNDEIALALPWAIKQLSFSADGRRLAGRLADGRAVVWDTGSRESWPPLFSTRYSGGQSSGAFLLRKGGAISTSLRSTSNVARGIGGFISLWNTSTFSTEQTLSEAGGDWFYDLKVAPDESFIIVLGSAGHVWRFELASGTATKLISGDSIYATAISFSPNGAELLVGTVDGFVVSITGVRLICE